MKNKYEKVMELVETLLQKIKFYSVSYNNNLEVTILPDEGYTIDTHTVMVGGQKVNEDSRYTGEGVKYGLQRVKADIVVTVTAIPLQS